MVHDRWLIDANFNSGPVHFFDGVVMPLRPVIARIVRRQIRRDLHGQGLSRHTSQEREAIGRRGIAALSAQLGDKAFLMAETPTSVDAIVFGTLINLLSDRFETPLRHYAAAQPNLAATRDRCMALWFSDVMA